MAGIEVVELTPDRADDYAALFDAAFPDNPDWAGCYCGYYDDTSGQPWRPDLEGARNRAARLARIRDGRAAGLLAYADDRPVGWCNVAPRRRIPNLRRFAAAVESDADDPAVVMCFVIAPDRRGQGVARSLLQGAILAAGRWASPWIEAYPSAPETGSDGLAWTAASYKGPLSLYLKAGFTVAREMGPWLVVRRPVAPQAA